MTIDRNSRTWGAVEAHCQLEIDRATALLEQHGQTVEVTEYQRGRIAALRSVLRLQAPVAQPAIAIPPDDET